MSMKRYSLLLFSFLIVSVLSTTAWAGGYGQHNRAARWHNANTSWHGGYQNVEWGRPVALILPPTARMQTEYSWGVGRTRMSPINHQFARVPASIVRTHPADSGLSVGHNAVRHLWCARSLVSLKNLPSAEVDITDYSPELTGQP